MYTRKRIFEIIQVGSDSDHESRLFDYVLAAAILLNLFIALYSTFEGSARYEKVMFFHRVADSYFLHPGIHSEALDCRLFIPEKGSRSQAALKFFFVLLWALSTFWPFPFLSPRSDALRGRCFPYLQGHQDLQALQGHEISGLAKRDH